MKDPVYFEINVEMLRRHMECARGYGVTRDEFERTMRDAGFQHRGESWFCDRETVTSLEDSEIERAC